MLKGARALQYRQRIAQSHRGTLVRRCATRRGVVVIVAVPVWPGPVVSLVHLLVLGGSTVVHQTPSPTARRPAILMRRPALQAVVYRAAVCVMVPPSLSAVACTCTPLPRLVWGIRPGIVPQPVVSDCVPRVSDVLRLQPRPRNRLLGGGVPPAAGTVISLSPLRGSAVGSGDVVVRSHGAGRIPARRRVRRACRGRSSHHLRPTACRIWLACCAHTSANGAASESS